LQFSKCENGVLALNINFKFLKLIFAVCAAVIHFEIFTCTCLKRQREWANAILSFELWIQMVLLRLRISDIDNWNCRYLQFELCILTIGFVDIDHSNYGHGQCDLSISTIRTADVSNSYCWYRQFDRQCNLSVSTVRQFELWISTMWIDDIDNSYCWCQQFKLSLSTISIKLNDDSACHIGKVVSALERCSNCRFP